MNPSIFTHIKNTNHMRFKIEVVMPKQVYGNNKSLTNNLEFPLVAIYNQTGVSINENGSLLKELSYDDFIALDRDLNINSQYTIDANTLLRAQDVIDCQLNYSFF